MKQIKIERTRRHKLPAAWECGGGATNTGSATIWAEPDGKPPRAVYVRRRGHLSNSDHALILVHPGMWRIRASHHRGDFSISVERVKKIERDGDDFVALVEEVYSFDQGEWLPEEPPEELRPAVQAAVEKAQHYHCRRAYFIKQEGG